MGAAMAEMPLPVPGTNNVFHLPLASEASFGSTSYIIRRPEGNVIVDSPRFDVKLLERIQVYTPPPPPPRTHTHTHTPTHLHRSPITSNAVVDCACS